MIPDQRRGVDNIDLLLQLAELKGDVRALASSTKTAQEHTTANAERIEAESKTRDAAQDETVKALAQALGKVQIQYARATGIGVVVGAVAAATLSPLVIRFLG